MHDASRTARRVTGRRPIVCAVLVAVLLALFTPSDVGGAEAGRADRAGSGAAVAGLRAHPAPAGHRPGTEAAARPHGTDTPGPSPRTDPAGHLSDADAAGHPPGAVPRAHEECATVCSTRAGGRHRLDGERQTPPHLATTADATAAPSAARVRTPPSREPAPRSPGPAVHDRGRAPPASPGI
ncbi:hypothetical protein [Streptomyces fagopyri]|uniref:hypothetical protein n=1 Tax=Streptomyces fagopyri TaxID=2662397 RepID=UPI0037160E16